MHIIGIDGVVVRIINITGSLPDGFLVGSGRLSLQGHGQTIGLDPKRMEIGADGASHAGGDEEIPLHIGQNHGGPRLEFKMDNDRDERT